MVIFLGGGGDEKEQPLAGQCEHNTHTALHKTRSTVSKVMLQPSTIPSALKLYGEKEKWKIGVSI